MARLRDTAAGDRLRHPPAESVGIAGECGAAMVTHCLYWDGRSVQGRAPERDIQYDPADGSAERRAALTQCLFDAELAPLLEVQGQINARRPHSDWTRVRVTASDRIAIATRALYEPPRRHLYPEGAPLHCEYYTLADVEAYLLVLAPTLPDIITRFTTGTGPIPRVVALPEWDPSWT